MATSSKQTGQLKNGTIAEKKLSDGVDNFTNKFLLENIYKKYRQMNKSPANFIADTNGVTWINKHIADFVVSPEGVADKWPGQLNYSVETPDEDMAIINVKGFEHAPSTFDDSEIFYTINTSDVNYVLEKLQTGEMQEILWEQALDLYEFGTALKKANIVLPAKCRLGKSTASAPFWCKYVELDYDAIARQMQAKNIGYNLPLAVQRLGVLKQIEKFAIPSGGHGDASEESQNKTLAHTVARQKQLEDILSFAIPEDNDHVADLFFVYANDRVEECDVKNILKWYYNTIGESVTPNTKEEKMMLIPTPLQNIPTDNGVLRLRALHNSVDRLRFLDPKNEYALAANAALKDLESIAKAKGADLVYDEDAKDAARAIWANTILYLRDVYHKRSEVDGAKQFWCAYDPNSDKGLVNFFQTKAKSGEGDEAVRYNLCAMHAEKLQETDEDFPYGEIATALTFRKVSEVAPKAAAKIAKTYEKAKEKFKEKYPASKPSTFAISTSKDYSNIIVGDGQNYVCLPVRDVKAAKAVADILPYYSGAKHVTGAPDLAQYFSN